MQVHPTQSPTGPADIVALGEPLIEFSQVKGESTYRFGFGGDTSNFVIAAARVGARTAYLSRVGDEPFGRELLALWQREGVDCSAVELDTDAPTGIYFISYDGSGHHFSYRRAGSAATRTRLSDGFIAAIKGARWLHVSGITQAISTQACDTALQAMALARESGVRVSYDLNFRPRLWPAARAAALARASLAYTDLFLPSIDEAQTVVGVSSAQELIDWSLAQGARAVAVKRGALGACVSSGQELVDIPAWPVRAVDATGAGDCFGGVTVARLLAGDNLVCAARAGAVAAALATQGFGAIDPLPRWPDISACLGGGSRPW
jgi:2-dehydro-3-deoxygluconokinase